MSPVLVFFCLLGYLPPQLISMKIECKSRMLFDELENLFTHAGLLQRFILETSGEAALLHAHRWQALIESKLPHLKQLALDISPEENDMTGDTVLTAFETPFWKTEKHWQLACTISSSSSSCVRLFSVPYFSASDQCYPASGSFVHYALSHYPFQDQCKQLRVFHYPSPVAIASPFPRIEKLTLYDPTDSLDSLKEILNLSTVRHLEIDDSASCPMYDKLLRTVPNISQLSTKQRTLREMLEVLSNENIVHEQIKQLHLKEISTSADIDQICRTFPKLERISLFISERNDILSIFDRLPHLISSSIRWSHPNPTSSAAMDEYLQENDICTDGTYYFHATHLTLWHK